MEEKSFGEHLRDEMQIIDYVTEELKQEIFNKIYDYLEFYLKIKFIAILSDTNVNGRVGLGTLWVRGGGRTHINIKDDSGLHSGQASYSYDKNKKLWIVCTDKSILKKEGVDYIDLWTETKSEDIPRYKAKTNDDVRSCTSIILPLVSANNLPFGVVNFESIDYINISSIVKDELIRLTQVIQHLVSICKSNKIISSCRSYAKTKISELDYSLFKPIGNPKLFIAFPKKSDKEVIDKLKVILEDRNIEYISWEEISKNGIITSQIIKEIMVCKFGICYFSEQNDDKTHYKDNENVLLEAGMLCALAKDPTDIGSNWIPIREKDTHSDIPFDIHSSRIFIVPREKNNSKKIQSGTFASDFNKRLNSLLTL